MIIQGKRVWIGGQFLAAQLEIEGERIVRILPYGEKMPQVDCGDRRLVPGFIDVHTQIGRAHF